MFRKINTKLLAIIFVALLAIVVLVEIIDNRKGNRTFKSDLVEVNADEITTIELYPRANNGKQIKLFKENDNWKVESDGKIYNADQSTAGQLISSLNNMKSKSVAATSKDRWEQFEVTDSLGTRVKLFNGSNLLSDVIIGKFSFSQPRNMTSYVRLVDDKDVYGVEGMLGMTFNRNLNSFRDRTIIKSNRTDWTKLSFNYPADSSFVLEKTVDKWMIGETAADSTLVVEYFNNIASLTDGNFADEVPVIQPTHGLIIEGNNRMQKVEIKGYFIDNENFVLQSNQNPEAYFNSNTSAEKIFVSDKKLIKKEQ